jgi:V8-like Glu-specific endopeptidase
MSWSTRRPGRSAGRSFRPNLETLEDRSLPSNSPVLPTANFNAGTPNAAVAELCVTYPDGQSAVGSGAMIDSYHVLTAGDLLYNAKDGGYATSIEAIPDASNGVDPFGIAFGTYERVDPSWISYSQSNSGTTSPSVADIGLVTLNRAIGNQSGSFALGYNNNNAFFAGTIFQTAGYPAGSGLSGLQMYATSLKALGATGTNGITFSESSLTALPGQGGSPVWQAPSNGAAVIYGIVTGANGLTSTSQVYATRITQALYTELQSWQNADKTPPTLATTYIVALQHPAVTAAQLKGSVSNTINVVALDVGWASVPSPSPMFYGDNYYGSWGYNPVTTTDTTDLPYYDGPAYVQGYGSSYGTQPSIYSSDA